MTSKHPQTHQQQYHQTNVLSNNETKQIIKKYKWPPILSGDPKNPTLNWSIGTRIVIPAVGIFSKFWMNIVNKSTVYNANILLDAINNNYLSLFKSSSSSSSTMNIKKRPLITYCNHTSCMDDPLIWGSLLPLNWLLNSNRLRWTSAAAEICFNSKFNITFFALGKTFPVVRGEGIYQPAMDYASRLMSNGCWIHFFPEGKVIPRPENADPNLLKFDYDNYDHERQQLVNKSNNTNHSYSLKWGIARLIIDHVLSEGKENDDEYNRIDQSMDDLPSEIDNNHSSDKALPEVDVLPMYHIGMDDVLPTKKPYVPRIFKHVTFLIRPEGPIRIDRNFLIQLFTQQDNDFDDNNNNSSNNNHQNENTTLRLKSLSSISLTEKRIRLMKFLEKELNILAAKTKALHFSQHENDD